MTHRLGAGIVGGVVLGVATLWWLKPVTIFHLLAAISETAALPSNGPVTKADLTQLMRRALDFEVMPAALTIRQVPLGAVPSASQIRNIMQGARMVLSGIYASNSPEIATQLWGVRNTLEALPWARPVAGGVSAISLQNIRVIGPIASATWTAQVWSETVHRGSNGAWSPPCKAVNGLYGSATFTFRNNRWYLQSWDASYLPGEGP
jgi:hypothetical protein